MKKELDFILGEIDTISSRLENILNLTKKLPLSEKEQATINKKIDLLVEVLNKH